LEKKKVLLVWRKLGNAVAVTIYHVGTMNQTYTNGQKHTP